MKFPTYQDYIKGTANVLKESWSEKKKYKVDILGRKFVVHPGVFSPKYFFDTEFFAQAISIRKGEKFLEVGPGTGVISVTAALRGAGEVVAIDINPKAIKNAKENARLHHVEGKVKVLRGNLYQLLSAKEKFDTIFWNTPFGYIPRKKLSHLEKAVFDPEYKATTKFIKGAKQHLKPKGRLLIGFSQTLGKWKKVEKMLRNEGYQIKLLAQTKSRETNPVTFDLFEATL